MGTECSHHSTGLQVVTKKQLNLLSLPSYGFDVVNAVHLLSADQRH